jgi:hypothetical protein
MPSAAASQPSSVSPEFAPLWRDGELLWRDGELRIEHHSHQVIEHPAVGRLELDSEILTLGRRTGTPVPGCPWHYFLSLRRDRSIFWMT